MNSPLATFFAAYGRGYNPGLDADTQWQRLRASMKRRGFSVRDRAEARSAYLQAVAEDAANRSPTTTATPPRSPSPSSTSPLEAFFAHYDADYNRHVSAAEQYQSLGARRGWDRDDWSNARQLFNDAIAREFNSLYGEDVNRLDNWQSLCEEVHIDPVPNTIGQCKAAIRGVYVNIVDLVDSRTRGKRVDTFHTLAELSEYSQETRKIFPRNQASAGNLLKYLLREILGGSGSRGYYQRY